MAEDIDDELLKQQDEENKDPEHSVGNDGNGSGGGSKSNNKNNKKIEFAFKKAEEIAKPLFKDQYGVCYGWLDISGHKEVLKIESV